MEQISSPKPKKSFFQKIIPVIAIIVLVVVVLMIMGRMKTEPAKVPEKPKGFLVETTNIKPSELTITIQSQGTLTPKRQISLTTEISGKVMNLNPSFAVGGKFETGDVLIKLDPADYQVAVARAEANLASALAQLDLEQAKSDQALKDWESFGKKGKPSDLLLNIPQLDGAKASLKAAKADLLKAKRDLEKTEIKAPFDGTVINKAVDIGQFVNMSGQLGVIAGTEVAEVRLPLTNTDIQKLDLKHHSLANQPLPVIFKNEQLTTMTKGVIHRLESSKDSRTLMTYAVAEITQPFDSGLLYNSFLQAEISGPSFDQVYAIPTALMMPNDQLSIYNDDNTLNIKQVHVIHKTNEYFYVDQGITENDQIITTPIQAPTVGMLLRMTQPEPSESEPKEVNREKVS